MRMAKLSCGCEFSDYRPGGNFLLFAGNTRLGHSELEYEDSSDGVWLRSGIFEPAETYYQFQDIFQNRTRLYAALPAERERHRAEIQSLDRQIASLHLRLLHPDGTEIPIAAFCLQDCAYVLTDEPRELQVEINDRDVHNRFFSQPVDNRE